jgi:hypothetical protein
LRALLHFPGFSCKKAPKSHKFTTFRSLKEIFRFMQTSQKKSVFCQTRFFSFSFRFLQVKSAKSSPCRCGAAWFLILVWYFIT